MKRAFSILMCLFVLMQSGILSIQYVFKLVHHKRTIENGIEKGLFNSRLIPFTSSELMAAEWENDHEFFLRGKKYDVVRTLTHDGEIQYACINDKTEKVLMNYLEKSEKKSTLIEELLKKINIQVNDVSMPGILNRITEMVIGLSIQQDNYCFIFSRVINKPPIS